MEPFNNLLELLNKNPQVDRAKVSEALETVKELRKRGLIRARYNLVSPYSRATSIEPIVRQEDPRTVRLKTNR